MAHTNKSALLLLTLSFTATAAVIWTIGPKPIRFTDITQSNIAAIVASMFVIAVFMERSIEAILTPIRTPDKQKLEHELQKLKLLPDGQRDNTAITDKEHQLEAYRLTTAKYAYWVSFSLGIVISLVGVRILGSLVVLDEGQIDATQSRLFYFVDVVLTGGVISGGSAAIDKIGRRISQIFNLKSAPNSQQASGNTPQN